MNGTTIIRGVTHVVAAPSIGTKVYLKSKITAGQNGKFIIVPKILIDQSSPTLSNIETSISSEQKISFQANEWVEVPINGCTDYLIFVQFGNNRILFSYHIPARAGTPNTDNIGIREGKHTQITINRNFVKSFCSPGQALESAFESSLKHNTNTLRIILHENAGPFEMTRTLEMSSSSAVLQHVKNVEVTPDTALLVTFYANHNIPDNNMIEFETDGTAGKRLRKLRVAAKKVDDYQIRLKY